ncbi:formyltransferase family protein [Donghicola mangrovi]|uniref:UDP-glucuronic acid dehydrogenase n=1 Tax=Donghicola mangrovi TaxID=2729614 RepID=A0A850Q3Q9_9RHOB|nr:formyltransferase family protein [Donghicola mangrovi]NVO23594.1 UDP-glucuronic acid dehydrogenase [Donghicola mangrovi]
MKIEIICSDPKHPVQAWLNDWVARNQADHDARVVTSVKIAEPADLLFLVSCSEIVTEDVRAKYKHCFVLHASDLPQGRGWSPLVWQVIEGRTEFTLSMLDAADPVDSGAIWAKRHFHIPDHATFDEINAALFQQEVELMDDAIRMVEAGAAPTPQSDEGVSYYRRRTPADSVLDTSQSIEQVFDRLRVCDPERYPAIIEIRGHRYKLSLEKLSALEPHDENA